MRKNPPFYGGTHYRKKKVSQDLRFLRARLTRPEQRELEELQGVGPDQWSWKRKWGMAPRNVDPVEVLAWVEHRNDRRKELEDTLRRFRKYKRAAARRGVDFEEYVMWLAAEKRRT